MRGFVQICIVLAGLAFLFMVAIPSCSTILAAGGADRAMQEYVDEVVPQDKDESLYISPDDLRETLKDLEVHDERMADKIVMVAVSGDVAQTVSTSVQAVAYAAVFIVIGAVVLFGMFKLFEAANSLDPDDYER